MLHPQAILVLCFIFIGIPWWVIAFVSAAWFAYSKFITKSHPLNNDLHEAIKNAKSTGLRVAVIGSGISGVQSMKACLEEGIEPCCFEADSESGGFWRYKEDDKHPSVYRSTHIDTDRDMNSYGDFPHSPTEPLLLHNSKISQYLKNNIIEFGLEKFIHYNTRVDYVTPHTRTNDGRWTWKVTTSTLDPNNPGQVISSKTEIFDGVLICTGRHGGGGYIPNFPGLENFEGKSFHSSKYKHPEKHGLQGKNVVVVGVGNSGLDIVTEVSPIANKTYLVSRTGAWIIKMGHGDVAFSLGVRDRLQVFMSSCLPWWMQSDIIENLESEFINFPKNQPILNKHGLTPKHRFWQQHILITGLHDPKNTLHDQLESGLIVVKHGIQEFKKDGVIFVDDAGSGTVTKVDAVIFATGYRQYTNFLDPKVVDLRFERTGNDVMMYKYIFPISEYTGIGFINFCQSVTFMCSELQSRFYVRVLKGLIKLPSLEQQRKETEKLRQTLCAQFIDRQQLRIQGGLFMSYYDDLSKIIGCYPYITKLLTERPTAIWHSWFTDWQGLHYRLVGPGALGKAEEWIENLYQTRYYGCLPDGTRKVPINRGSIKGYAISVAIYLFMLFKLAVAKWKGFKLSPNIEDHLEDYVDYAKNDVVSHSLTIGEEPKDVKEQYGGKKLAAFKKEHTD